MVEAPRGVVGGCLFCLMGKVSDDDTSVVLRKLACCFPAFYALYYGAAAIVCAAFGLFDAKPAVFGKMPFNFELFDEFSFGSEPQLGTWWPPFCAPCAAYSAPGFAAVNIA